MLHLIMECEVFGRHEAVSKVPEYGRAKEMRQIEARIGALEEPMAAVLVDITVLGELPDIRERYATQKGALEALGLLCVTRSRHSERTLLRLLERDIDVESRDDHGNTALHLVVRQGPQRMAEILIHRGADTNARNNDGISILEDAINSSNTALMRLLLDNGASSGINGIQSDHPNAVQRAAATTRQPPNHRVFRIDTPRNLVALLVDYGADVNSGSRQHLDALSIVARRGKIRAVQLLLQHSASVKVPGNPAFENKEFGLPLQEACRAGKVDVVKVLLEHGAGANTIVKTTDVRRGQAYIWYHPNISRTLLDRGTHLVADQPNALVR
jgi:hypothetical protein